MPFSAFTSAIVSIVLAQLVSSSSVDPEEALFSFTRCAEIYAEPLQHAARLQSIQRWESWSLEAWFGDNTECYVQCILERLGLFDPNTGKLKPEQIDDQFNDYGSLVQVWSDDRNVLKEAFSDMNREIYRTCNALFNAYLSAIQRKGGKLAILQKLYHDKQSKHIYDYLAEQGRPVRVIGQSYFEYCEKKFYSEDTAALCKIRQYQIDVGNPENFKNLIECIFKGLRYIDAGNNVNSSEIIRDFRLVNKPQFNEKINQCAAKQDAVEVYKCLVQGDSDFLDAFQEAFDYREIRARNYEYRLEHPVYDKQKIKEEVEAIDKGISCA